MVARQVVVFAGGGVSITVQQQEKNR